MRKLRIAGILAFAVILSGSTVFAQKSKKKNPGRDKPAEVPETLVMKTYQDTISYLIGRDIGSNMTKNDIQVNPDIMFAGLKDGLNGNDSLINQEVTERCMNTFQQEMMAKQQKKTSGEVAANKAAGAAFLAENKTKEGVVELPDGLQYKVEKEGEGDHPKPEDTVEVHYTGSLIDGTVFDSSVQRGESIKFPLNGVIPGWTEGVQLMKPGAKYIFYIPSSLAYGDRDTGPIPGGSTLIFEVELLSIQKK